jgi:uncharacterized protein (TIGR00725 family)
MERNPRIGVIGPSQADAQTLALAEHIGGEIAKRGAILICGGLGGVMEAAARGAKREHGLTVGILPTPDASSANPFIDIPIATGLGEARNVIVVRSADAVIAIAGGYGTLSEIAFALRLGIPVVGLGTWQLRSPDGKPVPLLIAESPSAAVEKALAAATR